MSHDHFSFYDLQRSFYLDDVELKSKYLILSKKYHPDFFTLKNKEEQEEALKVSTLNNLAYNTLKDFDLRLHYILVLEEILDEEGKNDIPQEFLMEMMDFNEQVMDAQMENNIDKMDTLIGELEKLERESLNLIEDTLKKYPDVSIEEMLQVKNYYLKKKYLLRIKEKMDSFAGL